MGGSVIRGNVKSLNRERGRYTRHAVMQLGGRLRRLRPRKRVILSGAKDLPVGDGLRLVTLR
jgi:hypothetical protein